MKKRQLYADDLVFLEGTQEIAIPAAADLDLEIWTATKTGCSVSLRLETEDGSDGPLLPLGNGQYFAWNGKVVGFKQLRIAKASAFVMRLLIRDYTSGEKNSGEIRTVTVVPPVSQEARILRLMREEIEALKRPPAPSEETMEFFEDEDEFGPGAMEPDPEVVAEFERFTSSQPRRTADNDDDDYGDGREAVDEAESQTYSREDARPRRGPGGQRRRERMPLDRDQLAPDDGHAFERGLREREQPPGARARSTRDRPS